MPAEPDICTDVQELAPLLDALARRGHPVTAVRSMAGDVSRRRYFRVRLAASERSGPAGGPAVLAVYPDEMLGDCRRYLETGRLLADAGVRVAEVIAGDCGSGWMLLEDFGERTLYEHRERPWSELEKFFEDAVDAIGKILRLPDRAVDGINPSLDRTLLRRELAQTREACLAPLGLDPTPEGEPGEGSALGDQLWTALDAVCDRLAEAPPAPCHRDFGARNLMPLPAADGEERGRRVGVLDHQDLRLGPPAYDLASLLNDSLFPPPEVEERLLVRAGSPAGGAEREAYHRAAAQRTLKAVGSYAAFARRGSDRHLGLIPATLERAVRHLAHLPESGHLAECLADAWRPAVAGEGLERLVGVPD